MMLHGDNTASQKTVDYRKKYKVLKRKLKYLLYEQECFVEELRSSQQRLLKVTRDRSFLLDRLLQYENVDTSEEESESTSESEAEAEPATKKKKAASAILPSMFIDNPQAAGVSLLTQPLKVQRIGGVGRGGTVKAVTTQGVPIAKMAKSQTKQQTLFASDQKKSKVVKKAAKGRGATPENTEILMTREELEQHLEQQQRAKPVFARIDPAPQARLPDDIFGTENSNPDNL